MSNILEGAVMKPTRPPFPRVFDATQVRDFRSCPHKFFLARILGLSPVSPSIHLHAGGVFAKGQEIYRKTFYSETSDNPRDANHALCRATVAMINEWGEEDYWLDHAKSLPNIILALEESFNEYPPAADVVTPHMVNGEPGVEFNFVLPIPDLFHPETLEPILYTGRFDMLAEYQGMLYVEDDKTATSLGASWLKQWDLRSQFTGYCWGAQSYGKPVVGAIIRGTAILKTKFTFMQAVQARSQWEIDRWLEQTRRDILRAIQLWEEGYWDYNLDNACNEYGGCTFKSLCTKEHPERWIEPDFEVNFWDPLHHTKAGENPNASKEEEEA